MLLGLNILASHQCTHTMRHTAYTHMLRSYTNTCSESLQARAQRTALACGRAADQRDAGGRGCKHDPAHCERLAGDAPAPDPARGQVCGPLRQPLEPRRYGDIHFSTVYPARCLISKMRATAFGVEHVVEQMRSSSRVACRRVQPAAGHHKGAASRYGGNLPR